MHSCRRRPLLSIFCLMAAAGPCPSRESTSSATLRLARQKETLTMAAAALARDKHGTRGNTNIVGNFGAGVAKFVESGEPPSEDDDAVHGDRLPSSYNGRQSLFLFSSKKGIPQDYDFGKSTQENYNSNERSFTGPFATIRKNLDHDYHGTYSEARQLFQDEIIVKLLDGASVTDEQNGMVCSTPTEPWIVFTAGVMGAGKSHTMKELDSRGLFPLKSYVKVDPDEIRSYFPEYHSYAQKEPERAGELTNREAGYITEIIAKIALKEGYNVLVDGSLRNSTWYGQYFSHLRSEYPVLRIAILHITAPEEAILERAERRGKETGRVVPIETLQDSLTQVPESVKLLAPLTDYFCELHNAPNSRDVVLATDGITWDSFRDNWAQTCPWPPKERRRRKSWWETT